MSRVASAITIRVAETPDVDAVFAGWQETGSNERFALYTITATAHPFRGSTVSERTLRKMHLRIPGIPPAADPATRQAAIDGCSGGTAETRCIGPYHSRIGCSAYPVDGGWAEDNEGW